MRAIAWAAFSALLVAPAACAPQPSSSGSGDGGGEPQPTFGDAAAMDFPEDASPAAQARYVFGGCVGGPEEVCHSTAQRAEGMVLPDTTPTNLVDVPSSEEPVYARVRAGDPPNSYLYMKVTDVPGIAGVRMPKDRLPLDDRSIRAIAAWIDAGAPAN